MSRIKGAFFPFYSSLTPFIAKSVIEKYCYNEQFECPDPISLII